jgi:acetolactate synthase small subunit
MLAQADNLILSVIRVLEGNEEAEIVRLLLRLRDALTRQEIGQELDRYVEAARAEVINVVNNFFYEKLTAVPTIKDYIADRQKG